MGIIQTNSGGMLPPVAQRYLAQRTVALAGAAFVAVLLVFVAMVAMASPAWAADFAVTKTADTSDGTCDADCSLREAINAANGSAGADAIGFSIPGDGPHTIAPLTQLPTITGPVTIDGYTQGDSTPDNAADDASPNTLATGSDAVLKIVLDGMGTTSAAIPGLVISANGSVVKGLVIGDFNRGITINAGFSGNRVEGNHIGTNAAGDAKVANFFGVDLQQAKNNTVGGTTPGARNVISGNTSGVYLFAPASTGNKVEGNYIGTNAAGTAALGNSLAGVQFSGAVNNTAGGTTSGARNLISGNAYGVFLTNSLTTGNRVEGNHIGTNAAGTAALANSYGVYIQGAPSNTVGGTTPEASNVISGNTNDGISVVLATNTTGNRILGNSIFANANLGIDLTNNGVTANDDKDPDTGPNNLQNYPVVQSAKNNEPGLAGTTVRGTLNSTPSSTFTVQFFSNPAADPSEGKKYLGEETDVTTDADGNASFVFTADPGAADGETITATATNTATGDTSEFSAAVTVVKAANLSITKTDDADPVGFGDDLTYTLTVNNSDAIGTGNATGVRVTDTLPTNTTFVGFGGNGEGCTYDESSRGVTCQLGVVDVGASAARTIVVSPTAEAAGTTLSNTATVSSPTDPTDASDTQTTEVGAAADLSITKTDDADPVGFGDDLTYTLTVNNSDAIGTGNATGVRVTDTLPTNTTFVGFGGNGEGCTYGESSRGVTCDLGAVNTGDTATRTVVVRPTAEAVDTTLSNTATVSSRNDPSDSSDTQTTAVEAADLSITKADDADPLTFGDDLTYTIEVMNSGTAGATDVTVTDDIPSNTTLVSSDSSQGTDCSGTGTVTCELGTIDAGGSATVTIVVRPTAASIGDGSTGDISNTASVAGSEKDPNEANNSATETTTINAANLTVDKTSDSDTAFAGQLLTYTISISNTGEATATGTTLTDPLPTDTTFDSASASQGDCTTPEQGATGGTVSCELGDLAVEDPSTSEEEGTATVTIAVRPSAQAAQDGSVYNKATASSPNDPRPGADGERTTVVEEAADLSITKTDDADPVGVGEKLTYTLTLTNDGPNDATGVTAIDDLPQTVIYDDAASSSTCELTDEATNEVSCGPASLTASGTGSTKTFTVVVTPQAGALPSITNNATVSGNEFDPDKQNDSATQTTTVNAAPTLSIDDVTVEEGDAGTTTDAVFAVTLSSATTNEVTVQYATSDGTATDPGDYAANTGTLTFRPGDTSKTVTVLVNGDAHDEGAEEDYFVDLSVATNASISDGQGKGTITDDDLSDTTAPTVTDFSPTGGQVRPNANVTATFSEAMNKASVEALDSVKLRKQGTTKSVAAEVTYDAATHIVTLNPKQPLEKGTTYVAKVRRAAQDEAGNAVEVKRWTFRIAP